MHVNSADISCEQTHAPGLFKDEALQSLSFEGRSLATMLAEECPTQRPVDESPAAAALVTPPAVASKPQRPDAVCKSVSHPVSQETSAAPSHCDTKNAAATKKDTPAASTSTCAHDPTNSMTPTPGASSQQHRESTPELQEKDPCRQEEELVFDAVSDRDNHCATFLSSSFVHAALSLCATGTYRTSSPSNRPCSTHFVRLVHVAGCSPVQLSIY